MIRLFVVLVVGYFVLDAALLYGGIWDSQANPTEATVTLPSGQQLTGSMTRDWDQSFVIVAPNGQTRFTEYRAMAFPTPNHARSVWHHWRLMMAVVLPSLMLIAFVLSTFKPKYANEGATAR